MQIRFFNDIGPDNAERLLIGIAADEPDRGQAREAVRVATPEDVENYAAQYQEYLDSFADAAAPAPASDEPAPE